MCLGWGCTTGKMVTTKHLTSYNTNAEYAYSGQAGKIGLLGTKLATLPCMDDRVVVGGGHTAGS